MKKTPLILKTVGAMALCLMSLAARAATAFDDFESYAPGSSLHGQGGWAGWAGDASAGALVSTNVSFSPTRSANISGASDLVRTFAGATNGQWTFRVMQYVPSTSAGTNYSILLNTYRSPYGAADLDWSVQIQNNLDLGLVVSDLGGGASLPMVKDQWVEVRCEIDLDANTVSEFYNGKLLSTHAWQGASGVAGLNEIQAVDLFANSAGPVYYDNLSLIPRGIIINVEVGRKTQGCTGFGICRITIDPFASTRSVPVAAAWVNGRLHLDYLAAPPDRTDVLTIDEDIVLDSPTARALGYEQVTVRAGQYPVDFSVNAHGQVSPDVTTQGIVITIDCRRRCVSGFGFCSITIGSLASDRAVPASATWNNGRLQFSFLAEPPDKTNVLVLDEDIVLDNVTSRSLGYEQVTLRAGQYPVDFSVNPHGQVNPDTLVQGLTIWVKIGLPKAGGCVPGFGICGIGMGNPPFDRGVQASATWANGRLQLGFLSEPPDKTNMLTLEQDVMLDSVTSRALGYEQITLRAGQYPVDYSVNPHGQVSPDVMARGIIITVYTGHGASCTGFGICGITIEVSLSARAVPVAATWVDGRLQLNYLAEPPDKADVLTIDKDIVLDSATARALGYEQVTVHAGQYPVDYSVNPHGQVSPDVTAQGIVITIDLRRRCVGGFGFCSIVIGPLASDRAVPASATWNNGRLQFSFLAEPPDKTNLLVLDEDIVLDNATSRALGYEQVILRAGQYPVDFSVNPHGQVSPDTTVQGLTIWVKIGLPKAGGCVPGFGICGIGMGNPPFDRGVQASATWANGRLQLGFLSEPPDKTNMLTLEQDVMLDSVTSRALGYEQITLRAGQYPVDYSVNPHGQVSPDVTARGIIITVYTGHGTNCTGFGICGITIEISLSARAVPVAATWVDGRLQLNYLAEPPDKADVLTIDKDIVLDSATARALGYEQVTVHAGQYPVDYSVNPHGQVSPDVTAQGIVITIDLRRRCVGGFGFCSIVIDPVASDRAVPASATWSNGRLQFSFLAEPPDKTNVLVLDEDIVLDNATSRALGYEQVTLRAGQYPVDFSVNPHGQVSPDVIARGIIITIDVGRKSLGCTGFGICRITIEAFASDRAVQAAATWVNGRLQLNYLAEPPDKDKVLTIDEDIVLDNATARALGYEQVAIRAGQYSVDYSVNPHGQVSPDVTTQGIVITIDLRRHCLGGFGFCRIVIDPLASDRAVPASATWNNGRLQFSFLAEPPDRTNLLVLDEDIVLDTATSRALGYEQVTLRAGQYPVDFSVNPHGQVSPDTTVQGLTIWVKIGLPKAGGCVPGFGICGIGMGNLPFDRGVQASATWANGRLQLSFLSEPPDRTNVLTLEQDVALDSATSRALGYEQVTLRAGQYPVDYSVNPHGQVSPDVTAQGIVITIDLRRHCLGGFGFCRIVIDPIASDRAVPASATWNDGRLQFSFLAEPPDKTNVLVLDEDIVLDSATSRALGYEQVTLRAGQYPVDFSVNPHGQVSPDVTARGIIITIDVGRKSLGCTGFGICSITIEPFASERAVQAAASWVDGRLQLNYLAEPPDKDKVLTIDGDIVLDGATARGLGYEQVTIRAGQYPVDYSTNPHGQVSPDVTTQGIIITIDLRRHCLGGFGFCRIVIDPIASDRAVPAAATWNNGRLQFSFLAEPPDKTNVLVLDEDIVLDSATSRALGYEQVTLHAGQYPVDFSVNPHGQVSPDVTARGIIITIDVGRKSLGCTGFGICSITIEAFASERAVQAAATWNKGRLQFSFLAEPPDKTNVLALDEDIVLDSATSRALGYEQVTLRAGQYPIDFSVNPHGEVAPEAITHVLNLAHNADGTLALTWPNNGWVLQEASDVAGPWTNSPTQTSPAVLKPDAARKFYRLIIP